MRYITMEKGSARTDMTVKTASQRTDERVSAADKAVRAIQEMIRTGALEPGQQLPAQRSLSSELNVSRASLREALSTLEALGFLRTEQGRGSFVTASGASDQESMSAWRFSDLYELREVYEFRALTESAAIKLAALNMSDDELGQLAVIHENYSLASRSLDLAAAAKHDMEFHRLIMKGSGNRLYDDVYKNFLSVFRETQMLPFSRHDRRWEPVAEHGKILESLRHRDPDGASYYMSLHMQKATQRLGIDLVLA